MPQADKLDPLLEQLPSSGEVRAHLAKALRDTEFLRRLLKIVVDLENRRAEWARNDVSNS